MQSHCWFFRVLLFILGMALLIAPTPNGLLIAPNELKYYISSVCFILLLAWWFFAGGFLKKSVFLKSKILLLLLLFLFWAALSGLWAVNAYLSWQLWWQWLMAVLFFVLLLNSMHTRQHIYQVLMTIVGAASLVALLGIFQQLFDVNWIRQAVKPASFYGNKNMATHVIVLALPLSMALFFALKKTVQATLMMLAFVLMTSYLVYSQTRAGWLAFSLQIIVFTLMLLFKYRRQKQTLLSKEKQPLFLLFVLLALLIVINPSQRKLTETAASIGLEASLSTQGNARLPTWQNTLAMIADKPFLGVGLANWQIHYPLYHSRVVAGRLFDENAQVRYVHNDFLAILSELGVIGFLLLLCLFYFLFKRVIFLLRQTSGEQYCLIAGLSSALLGFIVNANFSFPLSVYAPVLLVMVYLAVIEFCYLLEMGNGQRLIEKKQQKNVYYLTKRYLFWGAWLLLLAAFCLFYWHMRLIQAENLYFKTEQLEHKKQWHMMANTAEKSYQLAPKRMRTAGYLAQANMNLGNYDKAQHYFEKALSLNPYNINTMMFFARNHIFAKRYKTARLLYENVLKIYPSSAKVHKNLGILLLNYLGNQALAISHFKKALAINPAIDQAQTLLKLIEAHSAK